jgi:hypothetical protein
VIVRRPDEDGDNTLRRKGSGVKGRVVGKAKVSLEPDDGGLGHFSLACQMATL